MNVKQEAEIRPLATLSVYSYIPPRRTGPKETSYYNSDCKDKHTQEITAYDREHKQAEGFDMKLHRDDRRHWQGRGLDIYNEERSRVVPVRSSSQYGHRQVPVYSRPEHSHVAHVNTAFYKNNGITWSLAEGYGAVTPFETE